jgi:hypothetical protein
MQPTTLLPTPFVLTLITRCCLSLHLHSRRLVMEEVPSSSMVAILSLWDAPSRTILLLLM